MSGPRADEGAKRRLEQALADQDGQNYVLKLYVTGNTRASLQAVANIRRICEDHLEGRYELKVVDLYQEPKLAAGEQIVAAPTLIKKLPLPLRRVLGNMSDTERVLVGLDLQPTRTGNGTSP